MSLDTIGFAPINAMAGHPGIDTAMVMFAEYLVLFVPLTLLAYWFTGRDAKKDAVYTFGIAVIGVAVSYGLGLLYSHPSPFMVSAYDTIASGVAENAFPSQHTAVIIATAAGLYWRRRTNGAYLLTTAAVLTGFARVYIGEHYPLDLLGSVLAAGIALGTVMYTERYTDRIVDSVADFGQRIEDRILR